MNPYQSYVPAGYDYKTSIRNRINQKEIDLMEGEKYLEEIGRRASEARGSEYYSDINRQYEDFKRQMMKKQQELQKLQEELNKQEESGAEFSDPVGQAIFESTVPKAASKGISRQTLARLMKSGGRFYTS